MIELAQNLDETDVDCAYGVAAGETVGFEPISHKTTRPLSQSVRPGRTGRFAHLHRALTARSGTF